MQLKNQKTGLFFGSFNPIHHGHLMLANYIVEYTDLRSIWFVISPHNPFKKKSTLLEDHHRYNLVQESIDDDPRFFASNVEFNMPQPSYTIDTLTHLSERYPEKEFILIGGEDMLPTFHKWKNYELILKNYRLMIYNRPGTYEHPYKEHSSFHFIEAPRFEISSSLIRKALAEGKDMQHFMPRKAYEYIISMHLYQKQ